jgi:hypothetical protein
MAKHHVQLRESEDEDVAPIDERHLDRIAQGLGEDRAQLQATETGTQDRYLRAHGSAL